MSVLSQTHSLRQSSFHSLKSPPPVRSRVPAQRPGRALHHPLRNHPATEEPTPQSALALPTRQAIFPELREKSLKQGPKNNSLLGP